MIQFLNISKKFQNNFWEKEFFALSDVSFKINRGELIGFLGANGAGKTTLIKCLMDFSRPDSGRIEFDSNILGSNLSDIKSKIGYLPERAYLYQHLTGREFLEYSGTISNTSRSQISHLIKQWSEKIQIDHALDRHIRGYSKGMQQRLGFISALIHNPIFLVLDEPLSGLDPIGRRDFKKILKELNDNGTTIFFSSHIVSDVEEICQKVVFIEKSKLIYDGSIEDLILRNSNDMYSLTYEAEGKIRTIMVDEKEKNMKLNELLHLRANILGIEKNKQTLEEIIYKIKK